jgi:hypothetical protein
MLLGVGVLCCDGEALHIDSTLLKLLYCLLGLNVSVVYRNYAIQFGHFSPVTWVNLRRLVVWMNVAPPLWAPTYVMPKSVSEGS